MRRQAAAQQAKAQRQHISREPVRLAELQYAVGILRQQEQRLDQQMGQRQHRDANPPPPPPLNNHILHNLPPSQPHNPYIPPLPQLGTINPKSPLANHLQLAPWPPDYRAATPPKYHRNTDPRKFLMSYEAAIALAGEMKPPSENH
jgi:hypothetical protein